MALEDLLRRLADTPDTPCNPSEVSAKPAPIKACTLDTPDTPQTIIADTSDDDLLEITTETTSTATLPEPDDWPVGYGSLPTIADTDDRRTCGQCLNLRAGVCRVASPGGLVSANSGYRPNPETRRRCIGYQPNQTDTNQQPAAERWPGL